MKFEQVKLEHLGAQADDGVTLTDEINHALQDCARMMSDGLHTNKAQISVTIDMLSQGSLEDHNWSVMICPKVTVKAPIRERNATVAMMDLEGQLVRQKAEQLPMFPRGKKRVERDEAAPEQEAGE